jgi:hypothetical protein
MLDPLAVSASISLISLLSVSCPDRPCVSVNNKRSIANETKRHLEVNKRLVAVISNASRDLTVRSGVSL